MQEEQLQRILPTFRQLLVALIHNFKAGDYDLRKESAIALSKFKGGHAAEFLLNHFANDNIQDFMALALGNLDDKRAVNLLIQALNDPQHEVRFHAARALGMISNNEAFTVLMDALNNYLDTSSSGTAESHPGKLFFEEESVVSAINALGQLKNPLATSLLKRMINQEKNPRIRAAVISAMGTTATERMLPIFQAALRDDDARVRANAIEAIESVKSSAIVGILQPYLDDPSNRVRANVAKAIWKYGDFEVSGTLSAMLSDADKWQRASAAYAMGEMRDLRFVPQLAQALKDPDSDVRRNAAQALKKIEKPEAAIHLEPLLDDPSHEVRIQGAQALQRCAPQKAPALIVDRLPREPHAMVKATLISCLGEARQPALITRILPFLNDSDSRVQANTIEAIQKLAGSTTPPRAVVTAVHKQLANDDNRVRSNAIKALWQWDVYEVLGNLLTMLATAGDMRAQLSATFAMGEIGRTVFQLDDRQLQTRVNALIAELLEGPLPTVEGLPDATGVGPLTAGAAGPGGATASEPAPASAPPTAPATSPAIAPPPAGSGPVQTTVAATTVSPTPPSGGAVALAAAALAAGGGPAAAAASVLAAVAPVPGDPPTPGVAPTASTAPAPAAPLAALARDEALEAQLEAAANAFAAREFDLSERTYVEILQKHPHHLHGLMGIANLYLEQRRFEEAALHYEKALALAPTLVKAHYNLGTICYYQKDFDAAKKHLLEAIRLYPKILGAYLIVAQIDQLSGNTAESIQLLSKAAQYNPRNPILYQKLALLHLYERQFDRAAEVLQQAVSLSPLDAESHLLLSFTCYGLGDTPRAMAAIDGCLRACAQSPRPDEALRAMLRSYIGFKANFAPDLPTPTA